MLALCLVVLRPGVYGPPPRVRAAMCEGDGRSLPLHLPNTDEHVSLDDDLGPPLVTEVLTQQDYDTLLKPATSARIVSSSSPARLSQRVQQLRIAYEALSVEASEAITISDLAAQEAVAEAGKASRLAAASSLAQRALERAEAYAHKSVGQSKAELLGRLGGWLWKRIRRRAPVASSSSHSEGAVPSLPAPASPTSLAATGTSNREANQLYKQQLRNVCLAGVRNSHGHGISSSLVEATAAARGIEASRALARAQQAHFAADRAQEVADELHAAAHAAVLARDRVAGALIAAEEALSSAKDADHGGAGGTDQDETFGGLSAAVGGAATEAIAGFFTSGLRERKRRGATSDTKPIAMTKKRRR